MNWGKLAYTRAVGHDSQSLIRDQRTRPKKVVWSRHALARAAERMHMSPSEIRTWFPTTQYLGRWARCEGWGDTAYVAMGVRDHGRHGVMTITTVIPRAYWNYDAIRYDKMMNELAVFGPPRSETNGQKNNLCTTE